MPDEITPEATKELSKKEAKALEALQKENAAMRGELSAIKEQVELLMKGTNTAPKKPTIPADSFKVGDQDYKFTRAKAIIPGIGERTALEILQDDEPQPKLGGATIKEWMVNTGSILVQAV